MPVNAVDMLTLTDIAADLGVDYRTAVNYKSSGRLPPPDQQVGHSPLWSRVTFEAWKAARPGRGAGGGRPRGYSPRAGQA